MSNEDPNVWNLVIDNDGGGTNTRGVGLAVALTFDVICEIRDLLKEQNQVLEDIRSNTFQR